MVRSALDAQGLWQAFLALEPAQRRILRLLGALCQPIELKGLQGLLSTLGWQDERGRPLAGRATDFLFERLKLAGLVAVERRMLSCHPELREPVTQEAVVEGDYGPVAEWLRVRPSRQSPAHFGPRAALEGGWCRLRMALYDGREEEALVLLGVADTPFEPADHSRAIALIRIVTRAPNPLWLERLGDALKVQVLVALLNDGALLLAPRHSAWEMMEKAFPALSARHPEVALCRAEQWLIRGRLEGVEALLGGNDSPRGLALLGWLRFLQGRGPEALAAFDASLAATRRKTRKRNVQVGGLAGLFHLLALLESGRAEHLAALRQQVALCIRTPGEEPYELVYRLLGELAAVLSGDLEREFCVWLHRPSVSAMPHLNLFSCLAQHWLGQRPGGKELNELSRLCGLARATGQHWFAGEAALLLEALGGEADGNPRPQWHTLAGLVQPRAPWELALDALEGLAPGAGEGGGSGEGDLRMVWWLHHHGGACLLEPREQKRSKRGGWTQGRAVALERLARDPDTFDYLTPQDRRICQCIQADADRGYFQPYHRAVYLLDPATALPAAVGHPLVFRAEAPDTRVELVAAEPILEVCKEQDGLRLRLEPTPRGTSNVVVREESGGRLCVVRLDAGHRRIAEILGREGLKVPVAAQERVLASIQAVAPLVTVHSAIGGGSAAEAVDPDPRPHLQLQPAGDGLRLALQVQPFPGGGPLFRPGEGGRTVFAEVGGSTLQTERDLAQERRRAAAVLEACPALEPGSDWDWALAEPEEALDTLERLQALGEAVVLEWPQGRRIRLAPRAELVHMQLGVRARRDWLALEGGLRLEDGQVLAMSRLLELMSESPGRFLRLGEDQFLSLTGELRRRLETIRAFTDKGRFHPLAAGALAEATDGMQLSGGKPWRDQLARLAEARALRPPIPATLQAELRDYQAEGFRWLARLAHWGAGACLADDMGLGKTVQALALILARAGGGPTLVLAPTSVCANWLQEVARFAPTLRALPFGPGDRGRMLAQAGPNDLVVCSYGLLQSEAERLAAVSWHTLVADEAQAIKNALTKRSKAAMALPGAFRAITTGTPVENHLGELWNLFRFINPGLLGSREAFNRRFAVPIEQRDDADARHRLRRLLRPFILRRLKSDVLTELPPRTEITVGVEPGAQETALYEALRRQALERMAQPEAHPGQKRIRLLAEIMRLRRACCNPELVLPGGGVASAKLEAFGEILEELRENRHRALVFSQFVDHLALIRAHLERLGVGYQYLDGATPAKARQRAVEAFQAGEGELFLISLKAGGTGLNLTAADYVIHMDPWWNPAVEDQASDRAHRIGQQRPVTVYRLVVRGTIEEQIVALHRHKRDLADGLLAGGDGGGQLSMEELLTLLGEVEA